MILPASSAVAPPARDLALVLQLLARTPNAPLALLERIADAVDTRLRAAMVGSSQVEEVAAVVSDLESSFLDAVMRLMKSGAPESRLRAAPLFGRITPATQRFIQELATKKGDRDLGEGRGFESEEAEGPGLTPWQGWFTKPTVGWLARGEWLDAPPLLRRYDSVAEYTTTLQRLMTLLTFYWGAGAVWPKCRHRQGAALGGGGGTGTFHLIIS